MPLDPVLVAEARAWLARASRDLQTAAYELQATPPFSEDALFHAQQAVEKTLKAFLTWHGRVFRKTHNLVELGESCAELDPSLESLLRKAAPLTEYAWKFRYPGEWEEPTLGEAELGLAVAGEVVEAVLERLPDEVRP
jgi:HEPN domain-containing protein